MTDGFEGSSLSARALRCPKCALPFEPGAAVSLMDVACSACRSRLSVALFPAFESPPEAISTASGEKAGEGEAACFFHSEKRADCTCDRCGRFICALCDLPFAGRHFCPKCLDTSKLEELVSTRFVGGYVSMLCGVVPLVFFPLGCIYIIPITGPAAVGFALWSWKKPGSLVHGPRHGMALAGLIGGTIQLLAMAAGIAAVGYKLFHG